MWLECRSEYLDTGVDGTNPGIIMLCPWARHFIRIASVDSAVKWVPVGVNTVNGVQCCELLGGIALKNDAFLFSIFLTFNGVLDIVISRVNLICPIDNVNNW